MSTTPEPGTIAHARELAAQYGVHSLLSDATVNPKVAKNAEVVDVFTTPLHLAPANSSGVRNTCVRAGVCKALCLHKSGNPGYLDAKEKARIARTKFFHFERAAFMNLLVLDVASHRARAQRKGMVAAVRPNGTSDELWERFAVTVTAEMARHIKRHYKLAIAPGTYRNLMEAFPDVQFYDYTKHRPRDRDGRLPANYSLTYSYDPANDPADLEAALDLGWNVAVPYQVRRGKPLPTQERRLAGGRALRVIDGDLHDFRPADALKSGVVGLRFKLVTAPESRASLGSAASSGEGFALPVAA